MTDYTTLPDDLPVPVDDGAADHLPGASLPASTLPISDGGTVDLTALGASRTVIYLYPLTGQPGTDLPEGWDAIPGARGCSTEACDFRDHFDDLRREGITAVWGLSSQDTAYQAEVVSRLRLPFAMISDQRFELATALEPADVPRPGKETTLHSPHPRNTRRRDRARLLPRLSAQHPREAGLAMAPREPHRTGQRIRTPRDRSPVR